MRFFKVLFTPISRHPTCAESILIAIVILGVLASIAIPPVFNFPRQGQSTRALADISGIETALTEILADAQLSRLEQLFNPDGVREVAMKDFGATAWPPNTAKDFQAAITLYTRTLYALLHSGKQVLDSTDQNGYRYGDVLNDEPVKKLGSSYLEIGNDPWGNLYNIYPGPWNAKGKDGSLLTIPFRVYRTMEYDGNLPGVSASTEADELTVHIDGNLDGNLDGPNDYMAGYPAPVNKIAYIWSNGLNLISGQALYNAAGYHNVERYDLNQDPESIAGGDDINNWDPANSWNRLY